MLFRVPRSFFTNFKSCQIIRKYFKHLGDWDHLAKNAQFKHLSRSWSTLGCRGGAYAGRLYGQILYKAQDDMQHFETTLRLK